MDKKTILGALAALLAVLAAYLGLGWLGGEPAGPPVVARQSEAADWYEIYFTAPTCPTIEERRGGLDEIIAADLARATARVDMASFDLDALPLIDALIDLNRRGIPVRLVVDDENTPAETINRLRRNGLSVATDGRSAFMHNKFIVIDGHILWTGSLNFSSSGAYCNNNHMVRIDDPRLAANYVTEMDEMADGRSFGPTSPLNTVDRLTVEGVAIENYFASEDAIGPVIAAALAAAEEEILFLAFSFTSEPLAAALFERAAAGVSVRGVFETSGAGSPFSVYRVLAAAGLPSLEVRRDGNPRVMHHKVIVIDRRTVIFGSYNFTMNAETANDENVLIVHDPTFAGYFVEEFETVWAEAEPR